MEIRQFQTFKKVAELKSFSKAAEALYYGKSTVSEHIQSLEREVGSPLFDRLGKTISVTATGRELYRYVVELLNTYDMIRNISVDKIDVRGELNIGVSESLVIYRLNSALSQFKQGYPNVNLKLISDNCHKLRERLYAGELDLIITLEPQCNFEDLITHRISEEELVFISGKEFNIRSISRESKDELEKECFIFTERECSLRKFFQNYLYNMDISPTRTLEFSSIEAVKQCVVGNLGVSLLPRFCVEDLIEAKKVRVIEGSGDKVKFLTQVSHHKNKWISPLLSEFMKYIEIS
ncbi:LysR family transcriptional regulator [Propionigenium maris DSM 9537]|uniref:LysR family transcriptional regulator n=1 Tax=Propionigenium maris DSM 9537 TaxID=1123000 RepID=A0A9W6GPV4_9FUSO|nr:LysR family transcriptional regulator [Propionigenium maris]GLI57944.1 LysR family transcriptional regulator [Propionigenium maris DSM 9537]